LGAGIEADQDEAGDVAKGVLASLDLDALVLPAVDRLLFLMTNYGASALN